MSGKRKGQSTLEYITVFVAIVAAIVAVAFTKLKPAVNNVIDSAANKITDATTEFDSADLGQPQP